MNSRIKGFAVCAAVLLALVVWQPWASSGLSSDTGSSEQAAERQEYDQTANPVQSRELVPLAAPSAPEQGDAAQLRVQVVALDTQQPIAGAQCVAIEPESRLRKLTNGEGIAQIHGLSWSQVRVTCDGFVGAILDIHSPSEPLVVELETAGKLEGVVVDHTGDHAPAGLLVIAVRKHAEYPDLDQFLAGDDFTERTEIVTARTDANGRFELNRLEPDKIYRVRAVGEGIATQFHDNARADTKAISLVGGRFYGAKLEFVTPSGGPFRYCKELPEYPGVARSFGKAHDFQFAWRTDDWCRLAGLPESYYQEPKSEHMNYCFAWGPFRSTEPYVQTFRWDLMGYEAIEGEMELVPVRGELPVSRYVVQETGMQWGTLEVEYLLPENAGWEEVAGNLGSKFELLFVRTERVEEPSKNVLTLGVDPSAGGIATFENFPAGEYEVTRSYDMGLVYGALTQVPNSTVSILPEQSTRISLDFRDLSAVEFVLTDSAVREYTGPFDGILHYMRGTTKMSSHFRFNGPPYRLVGVPPRDYTFDFDSLGGKRSNPRPVGEILDSPTFTVELGKTVQVDYQVDDSVILN